LKENCGRQFWGLSHAFLLQFPGILLKRSFPHITAVVNCGAVLYFQRVPYTRDPERQTKTTIRLG
jgi:hypothetical protein